MQTHQRKRTRRFLKKIIGRNVIWLETTTSVMDNIVKDSYVDGSVLIAMKQTSGRGKGANKWFSPVGGLYMAYKLEKCYPIDFIKKFYYLNALAVVKTLETYGLNPNVKWLNDVIVNNKKISGILIEAYTKGYKTNLLVVGIGVNVNIPKESFPEYLRNIATSMLIELGEKTPLKKVLETLLGEINYYLEEVHEKGWKNILDEWVKYSIEANKFVRVKLYNGETIFGIFRGISEASGEPIIEIDKNLYPLTGVEEIDVEESVDIGEDKIQS